MTEVISKGLYISAANRTGYKNVYRKPSTVSKLPYMAEDDDNYTLGRFATPEEAAQAYAKAAMLSRERLGDDARAWALYRKALKRDAAWAPALLGAGEIALERREWAEAERMFGLACSLLPGGGKKA